MNDSILQRDHKTVRGRIRYTSKKPERLDEVRGREWYSINTYADGSRTIIVHTEIDDRPSVMRDATYSLDKDWRPTDCFVRLTVDDKFMGTGWFKMADGYVECETYTALEGRVTQRMDTDGWCKSFQNHAIACDAWHLRLFDRSKVGEVQALDELILCSPDHRGATGPMLFKAGMHIKYLGEEKVTVEAGEFDAYHFQMVSAPGLPNPHPDYDIWCTSDGEWTFLKGGVAGYMQTWYELVELYDGGE